MSVLMESSTRVLPSTQWSSFEPWDYGGMKQRLENIIAKLDTNVLVENAQKVLGQNVELSKPFSAGQYWICFEMVAVDGRLVIGRARLPKHPDASSTLTEEAERYSIDCEVATMAYVKKHLPTLQIPQVYAYEPSGSPLASAFGAPYMLIEGFYGNTLQDVEFDMCSLPDATQKHIIAQWTKVQAEIATLAFPLIGSISSISAAGEPVIGKLASAAIEGLESHGPFSSTHEYFMAIADASVRKHEKFQASDDFPSFAALGAYVFYEIVHNTSLYKLDDELFPLNHMDLGTQNILVDSDFNFLAVIDWEFAQTAPWLVNHYPMPFPLSDSDNEIQSILSDPDHVAYPAVSKQEAARKLYADGFRAAETALDQEGRMLGGPIVGVLNDSASRIYGCFTKLGDVPSADELLVHEMLRLARGWNTEESKAYLQGLATDGINFPQRD